MAIGTTTIRYKTEELMSKRHDNVMDMAHNAIDTMDVHALATLSLGQAIQYMLTIHHDG